MIEDVLNKNVDAMGLSKDRYNLIINRYKYKLDNLVRNIELSDDKFSMNKNVVVIGEYANYFSSKLKSDYYMLNFIATNSLDDLNIDEKYSSVKLFAREYDVLR